MARVLNIAGLSAGLFALALQFILTVPTSMQAGRSLAASIVFYFSFFTILTNMLVAAVHFAALFGRPTFFARPAARAGAAVAIAAVGLVYFALLSTLWRPEGLFLLCDVLLHYATPVLYIAWWLTAGAEGSLRARHLAWWLLYPVAYALYVLARAPIAGEVPYPFLDASVSGWPAVSAMLAGIALLFVILGRLALAADRMRGRRRRGPGPAPG